MFIFLKNVNLATGGALVFAGSIKSISLRESVRFTHTHTAVGCKNLYSALFGGNIQIYQNVAAYQAIHKNLRSKCWVSYQVALYVTSAM